MNRSWMTISQRAALNGLVCDVVCTDRFYDFWDFREGRRGLVGAPADL
jgi:hypothetical protein